MHAAVVEAVPAGAHRSLAEATEEGLAAVVEHVVFAGHVEYRQPVAFSICSASSNSSSRESCETSPVWMMKSGRRGSAFTFAIASRKVARASALGGLLKPMWLSLSWTKVNGLRGRAAQRRSYRLSSPIDCPIPPSNANSAPVPAHAMQLR